MAAGNPAAGGLDRGACASGGAAGDSHIAQGTFSKGLGFGDLQASWAPLAIAAPVLIALAGALLRKEAR